MPSSDLARPITLPRTLHRAVENGLARLLWPEGEVDDTFTHPPGEPALAAPGSVSWRVCKNPLTVFIGGVAGVLLELAEPRVRSGVWEHTTFRTQPLARLQRTGMAAMMTVYGPRSRTEAMIAGVRRLHARVHGIADDGRAYRADDTELLDWVQATAAFGFLRAYERYVQPLDPAARDAFYAEGGHAARLYGAVGAPDTQAAVDSLFEQMRPGLGPSPTLDEFLHIVRHMPALPAPLRPLQGVLTRAAVEILPEPMRRQLALTGRGNLSAWQRSMVRGAARALDRTVLRTHPAVQSCLRLGLPADFLFRAHTRR